MPDVLERRRLEQLCMASRALSYSSDDHLTSSTNMERKSSADVVKQPDGWLEKKRSSQTIADGLTPAQSVGNVVGLCLLVWLRLTALVLIGHTNKGLTEPKKQYQD
ncbi:hypothetical protein Salat_2913300 [Sesamum alatum]|uniref:Uncharacterized protein n=1 Tax=Sesamum alatum TaxID=300844 RepID=A0AAE1XJN2_9LAMI|nr:hypothetical protein Salat_2913300 [Sesamum alatum]